MSDEFDFDFVDDEEDSGFLDDEFGDEFGEGFDEGAGTLPEEGSNRTFIIIAGALGGVVLLAIICILIYAFAIAPRQGSVSEQAELINQQNTEVARIVEQTKTADAMTAIVAAYTATPTKTQVPPTFTATNTAIPTTAVVAVLGTSTATLDPIGATATVLKRTADYNASLLTSTVTALSGTPPALADTGFADEVGLPVMLGVAALLIVVIFLARRLRTA